MVRLQAPESAEPLLIRGNAVALLHRLVASALLLWYSSSLLRCCRPDLGLFEPTIVVLPRCHASARST